MAMIHKSLPFPWPVVASSASSIAESASAGDPPTVNEYGSGISCAVTQNFGAGAQAHLRVRSGCSLSRSSNPNLTQRRRLLGSPYCQLVLRVRAPCYGGGGIGCVGSAGCGDTSGTESASSATRL
ncbi:hypothetical protein L1987_43326 [Smallanthus sonchifolius]|uniref:Uncharacterized protein n=1 Tax=Smallanthus sonchifolius TaxID=185202 RepID=A0ACB9GMC2_9ASTR|nr:hypothetical protein L1987_43326 [Smallanthus sonchifolius]